MNDQAIHDLNQEAIKLQAEMQKFLRETNEKGKDIYQGLEILRAKILALVENEHNDS